MSCLTTSASTPTNGRRIREDWPRWRGRSKRACRGRCGEVWNNDEFLEFEAQRDDLLARLTSYLSSGNMSERPSDAVAALRKIIEKGFDSLFYDYQSLLNSIKAGYDQASDSSDREAYRAALDIDVLLLDDLGAHRVTGWVEDTVTSIITHRCNNRKPLIATTNLPDSDAGSAIVQKGPVGMEYRRTLAEHIGARARSRLFEMCTVIRMPLVEDYRIRKAKTF